MAHSHGDKIILLVEDNPDDEALTLRALKKNNILNKVVVARDGVEALDYLFGTGPHAGRDTTLQPHIILLDLKLPKIDGCAQGLPARRQQLYSQARGFWTIHGSRAAAGPVLAGSECSAGRCLR